MSYAFKRLPLASKQHRSIAQQQPAAIVISTHAVSFNGLPVGYVSRLSKPNKDGMLWLRADDDAHVNRAAAYKSQALAAEALFQSRIVHA